MTESFSIARRILILTNPRAGARSQETIVSRLSQSLNERGFETTVVDRMDRATELAAQMAAEKQLHCVVGAGGDGTMTELANRTAAGIPLIPLPLGTENLLAKYLGIRADADQLAEIIARGRTVHLDAGRADERLFLLMASCGYDAEVVRRLHATRRGHIRHLSYVQPIWQSIRSYQYPELRVYCGASTEGLPEESFSARWVFLFNLPCYAGGLGIAPSANGLDGELDLCAFRRGSLARGLYYLAHVWRGTHVRLPDCIVRRVRTVRIEAEAEVAWQTDGDPGGRLPLVVECVARRLTLLVPDRWHSNSSIPTDGTKFVGSQPLTGW